MGIKQLYNDNLPKLPNEYGNVSVMVRLPFTKDANVNLSYFLVNFVEISSYLEN